MQKNTRMSLTLDEITGLIEKLDTVCKEAQELRERLQRAMADRASADRPYRAEMDARARGVQQQVSTGSAERRQTPRNRRVKQRRTSRRP